MPSLKTALCLSLATAVVVAGATAALAPPATAANLCTAMTTPVYHRYNPATRSTLLTTSATEAARSVASGYREDHGTPFRVAKTPVAGLAAAKVLVRKRDGDRIYLPYAAEAATAVRTYGYTNQGTGFYVATAPNTCTVPVNRYQKGPQHAYATTAAENRALVAAGWTREGSTFWAAPPAARPTPPSTPPQTAPASDPKFAIAVYPDTQEEVYGGGDSRYLERARYLVAHKAAADLDLRFLTSTGDNANWDTPNHAQYEILKAGLKPVEAAKLPYSLSIGNHDSNATGPGGSARPGLNIHTEQRRTTTFNAYFTASRYGAVRGAYEAGKVDNIWSSFNAGGRQWMVLNLELWPRKGAVDWARSVVAAHPNHNVIISTHAYLDAKGAISTSNGGYGDTSPKYLYDRLVSQYPNIRIVLSGHVGSTYTRTDTGVRGNKIVSYLTAVHSRKTNPIRFIEIDTAKNTSRTWVYGPRGKTRFPAADGTQTRMAWVKG